MFSKFLTVVVIIFLSLISYGQKEGMALIRGGQYIPLYGTDSNIVKVQDFYIDQYPVTNAEYVKFLRSEEHTSELQSRPHLVCRLLLEKKKKNKKQKIIKKIH